MKHLPAFAGQVKDLFRLTPGDLFLDLTLGDGGHTQEALQAGARVVSLDVDAQSIQRAIDFASNQYSPVVIRTEEKITIPDNFRWLIIQSNFSELAALAIKFNFPQFKAILADLGTSQFQLKSADRGFSFNQDGPLDMRLNQLFGLTAADLINALSEAELTQLLYLADEHQAKPIARAIVSARKIEPIKTTRRLADIIVSVKRAIPGKINPATKTFMALRMAVNLEREALQKMLLAAPNLLTRGGIIGVISFHSGEDRIVKQFYKANKKAQVLRLINIKPIKPNGEELHTNPKVRSAKLRLAQKI